MDEAGSLVGGKVLGPMAETVFTIGSQLDPVMHEELYRGISSFKELFESSSCFAIA